MSKVVLLVAALSVSLAGCLRCGTDEEYAKGTDGEWVITRLFEGPSCTVASDDFEQLRVRIDGDTVTALTPTMTIRSSSVYEEGDRKLVQLVVNEPWYPDPQLELPPINVFVTYQLELVPATARLEGSVAYSFLVATTGDSTSCSSSGSASGGRVADL